MFDTVVRTTLTSCRDIFCTVQKELENGDLKKMMEEAEQSPEFKMLMDALTKLEPGILRPSLFSPVSQATPFNMLQFSRR